MVDSSTPFDLFVSHRWSDKPWVEALVAALEGQGIKCWVDRSRVEPFSGITPTVQAGIAASRALLACYSVDYPRSRICQWELTIAYLAGEGAIPPQRCVLVVTPSWTLRTCTSDRSPINSRSRCPGPSTPMIIDGWRSRWLQRSRAARGPWAS